jgi:hypothetical protein
MELENKRRQNTEEFRTNKGQKMTEAENIEKQQSLKVNRSQKYGGQNDKTGIF